MLFKSNWPSVHLSFGYYSGLNDVLLKDMSAPSSLNLWRLTSGSKDVTKLRILKNGAYPRWAQWILHTIKCILTREAHKDTHRRQGGKKMEAEIKVLHPPETRAESPLESLEEMWSFQHLDLGHWWWSWWWYWYRLLASKTVKRTQVFCFKVSTQDTLLWWLQKTNTVPNNLGNMLPEGAKGSQDDVPEGRSNSQRFWSLLSAGGTALPSHSQRTDCYHCCSA